ncbi:head-to-tail adaptor [Arthrobacter phage SerialPhiller]|nr:head-to-tail adaptor [Arthrobacter phage Kels]WNO27589.1 head-to-tail adaptor [Arthrobacter phage Arielagos]WNT45238.1 head-to-tail adaptor [Arthrobacter phage SerialPhiller]
MAITAQAVQEWLGLTVTDEAVAAVVPAVNGFVDGLELPGITTTNADGTTSTAWSAQTELGAKMLAARLYRRRNSPAGVEAITEAGAAFVARYDSDISRLLQLDGFAGPRIG